MNKREINKRVVWQMWISDNLSLTQIAQELDITKTELNKIIK